MRTNTSRLFRRTAVPLVALAGLATAGVAQDQQPPAEPEPAQERAQDAPRPAPERTPAENRRENARQNADAPRENAENTEAPRDRAEPRTDGSEATRDRAQPSRWGERAGPPSDRPRDEVDRPEVIDLNAERAAEPQGPRIDPEEAYRRGLRDGQNDEIYSQSYDHEFVRQTGAGAAYADGYFAGFFGRMGTPGLTADPGDRIAADEAGEAEGAEAGDRFAAVPAAEEAEEEARPEIRIFRNSYIRPIASD